MKIFIIGMPGSGKSTLAKELAQKMSFKLIDTDKYIEAKENMKIHEIFKLKNEEKFRKIEHKALKEIIKEKNIIISTGGGMPCFYNNINIMNKAGKTIYLKASLETLFERLKDDITRPLIKNKNKEEIKKYIQATINEREKYYLKSNLIFNEKQDVSDLLEYIES